MFNINPVHFFSGRVGWLTDFTNWLLQAIHDVWDAFTVFLGDLVLIWFETQLSIVVAAVQLIPVPGFFQTYSLATLLGPAGPTIGWIMSTFRIGEGLSVIAAGYAFRLLRKFLTLFQW
jgi:hypothetical protein